MKRILNFYRKGLATIGTLLVFGTISTSDYYTIELGQKEPGYIWALMSIGFLMIILAVLFKMLETDK